MERQGISEKEAEEQVWDYAGRVGEKDVREMAGKADRISGFFVHVEMKSVFASVYASRSCSYCFQSRSFKVSYSFATAGCSFK